MKYLAVKNYERFQHYRDRLPPWIKLYNTLLDDYAFIELPESARIHLVLLWLVASRHENRIPYDLKFLARAIHAKSRINIPRLIDAGFLTLVEHSASIVAAAGASDALAHAETVQRGVGDDDASTALAPRAQRASPRARPRTRERRGEGKGEAEQNNPSASGDAGERVPFDFAPFAEAWFARYEGPIAADPNAAPLKWLVTRHGAEETLRRWVIYLASTEAQYASAAKLKSGWGQWATPPVALVRGGATAASPDVLGRAATLWTRYRTHNLLTRWQRPEYERIGAELVTAGCYASLDAFFDELRVTQPWSLGDARTDGYAINEIARRLQVAA